MTVKRKKRSQKSEQDITEYIIKKKKKFFFGLKNKKITKIFIRKTYTNIFITLTDLNSKVITCHTSGSSDNTNTNKRRKRIAQAVEKIILNINYFLKLYRIKYVHIILKMKVKSHVYTLLTKLKQYGVTILSISSRRMVAHNGVKGRNLRRL